MSTQELRRLKTLEGRQVGIALRGGLRIDDCQLVSAVRSGVRTLWLFANGADTFVPIDDVLELWQVAS